MSQSTALGCQDDTERRIDALIERLWSPASRLETVAVQRVVSFLTVGAAASLEQQLVPIQRLCRAIQDNSTVSTLELWLPEAVHRAKSANIVGDASDDLCAVDYSFLTDLLTHNRSLRRLILLASSTIEAATAAILAGLSRNTSIAHLEWQGGDLNDPVASSLWGAYWATTTHVTSLTLSNVGSGDDQYDVSVDETRVNGSGTVPSTIWQGLALNRSLCQWTLHQLDPAVVHHVLIALDQNTIVTHVTFTECDLSATKVFPTLPHLHDVRLAECRVTCATLESMSQVLGASPVQQLDLRGSPVLHTLSACRVLHRLLSQWTRLKSLVLEQCRLTEEGLDIVLAPASGYLSQLQSLNVRHNALTRCDAFRHASLPNLHELNVSDNALGDDTGGIDSLSRLLGQCRLTRLELESCEWTVAHVRALCRVLQTTTTTLQHLNLGYNTAVGAALENVATLLAPNQSLQSLALASCHVTDEGLAHLLQSMCRTDNGNECTAEASSLQALYLPWNQISQTGVEQLSRWIRRNQPYSLRTLDVSFNAFDVQAGLHELVDSVATNYWLSDLKVSPLYGAAATRVQSIQHQVSHAVWLNRSGRHYAVHQPEQVPPSHWPRILARAHATYGTQALYHMLREATPLWMSMDAGGSFKNCSSDRRYG